MVTTYRASTGAALQGEKKRFNDLLSSPRVISEHVNGILKGRWCWLNCIPCVLDESPESMKRILEIVDVIVILHNFLIQENLKSDEDVFYNEGDGNHSDDDSMLGPDDELNLGIGANDASGKRCDHLRAI